VNSRIGDLFLPSYESSGLTILLLIREALDAFGLSRISDRL
jgi:hypothetical protein